MCIHQHGDGPATYIGDEGTGGRRHGLDALVDGLLRRMGDGGQHGGHWDSLIV